MIRAFFKKWLTLAPLLAGLAWAGSTAVRSALETTVRDVLTRETRAVGLQVDVTNLRVGLLGTVQAEGVRLRSPALGDVDIPRVEAELDLWSLLEGEPVVDRLTILGPRVRLSQDQLGRICQTLDLCEPERRLGQARRGVARGVNLLRSRRAAMTTRREAAPARALPIREVIIDDLQLEVIAAGRREAPFLALYALDLRLTAGVDRYRISGDGHLLSVWATGDAVPFEVEGDVARDGFGLVVALDGPLALEAPGATVSFEEMGVRVGAQSDIWLGKVVVLPEIIDFTESWRAESVSAVLSMRSGLVPERVIVDGLKGELDLLALSDFADWLASPPDTSDRESGGELDELRRSIVNGLSAVRTGLYGTELVLEAGAGDIQLRRADGTTVVLESVSLELARGVDGEDTASVAYRGSGERERHKRAGGRVEVLLRQLTAASIASWAR